MVTEKPKIIAAYKLTDTITGAFYIGFSGDLNERLNSHRRKLTNGKHHNENFQRSFSSWNNIEIEFIQTQSIDGAQKLEQSLLDFHISDDNCTNICQETSTGRVFGESTIAKMSEIAKNRPPPSLETRQKLSEIGKGRPKTEEHKQRIREASLVRPARSPDVIVNRRPVIGDGVRYASVTEACNATGMSMTRILYRLKLDSYPEWRYE